MGGPGSGRRRRTARKDCFVDDCLVIDINELNRDGILAPRKRMYITWHLRGTVTWEVAVLGLEHAIAVSWHSVSGDGREGSHITDAFDYQVIPVAYTACNYGGQRPWFLCPAEVEGKPCGRRVAKLYELKAGTGFHCRGCRGFVYKTQYDDESARLLSKCRKIRKRLGSNAPLIEIFPLKPKWMHWKTYNRLAEAEKEAEDRHWSLFTAEVDRSVALLDEQLRSK